MALENFRERWQQAAMTRDVAMAQAAANFHKAVAKIESAFAAALSEAKAYEDQAPK